MAYASALSAGAPYERCQVCHPCQLLKLKNCFDDLLAAVLGPTGKGGAFAKLVDHIVLGHRNGGMTFCDICPCRNPAPVFQYDIEEAGKGFVVVLRRLLVAISGVIDPGDGLLNVGTIDHFIGKLRKSCSSQ